MSRGKDKSRIETLNIKNLYKLINDDKLYGYREFCRILEIPILNAGSASQQKQLRELNMICEYEKDGNKYRFIKIRSEDELVFYNERAIYAPLIKYIISEKFLTNECKDMMIDGILYITMSKLLEFTGMVNENFNEIRTGENLYDKRMGVTLINKGKFNIGDLKLFINVSYQNILKPIMRDALKSMDNEKSILIQKAYKVYTYTDRGRIYKNVLGTSEEGKMILHICGEAMSEMGIKNMKELYSTHKGKLKEYYELCDKLCGDYLGYDGFYDCYAIIIDNQRTRHNLNMTKMELNKRIKQRVQRAKQFDSMTIKNKDNLINAIIDLETEYNFRKDYQEYLDMKKENFK